jgi:hypothetical protein
MQRREAADLHGIDPQRVVVTGAQAYDHWFAPAARRRARSSARVSASPRIGRCCCISARRRSSRRTRWASCAAGSTAIRQAADPALRRAAILIRPHPQNAAQWKTSIRRPTTRSASGRAPAPIRWTARRAPITSTRCSTAAPSSA